MQYSFHPIESRIMDLLLYPQSVDFTMQNKECADSGEANEYAPEHLTEEFQFIETSLKPFEKRIRKFYFEAYSLPRFLLHHYSLFGHSSAESYFEMLEREEEKALLASILTKLIRDLEDNDTATDSVILEIAQDIHQQMNVIDSLKTNDEEKWKLVGLVRNCKPQILEWIQLMREVQPIFNEYYAQKAMQVEAYGNQLIKEFNESNGDAISILSKGLINKSVVPSNRILISCMEPISIYLYVTTSEPFIFWGLEMEKYLQFKEEAQESELKERVLVFKNLGDKTRYEVVKLIAQGVESAKTISNILDVSQPTISYHINNLLTSKVILLERNDSKYQYKVNFEQLQKVYTAMLKDFGKKEPS